MKRRTIPTVTASELRTLIHDRVKLRTVDPQTMDDHTLYANIGRELILINMLWPGRKSDWLRQLEAERDRREL